MIERNRLSSSSFKYKIIMKNYGFASLVMTSWHLCQIRMWTKSLYVVRNDVFKHCNLNELNISSLILLHRPTTTDERSKLSCLIWFTARVSYYSSAQTQDDDVLLMARPWQGNCCYIKSLQWQSDIDRVYHILLLQ